MVRIEASPPQLSIYYAGFSLGKWKAELKSAHGETSRTRRLSYSGPEGEWLEGATSGPNGVREEIDFGHKEGNFVVFTMKFLQPDGKRLKTCFIGKMTADKIAGTFVDDSGITGEWTAVRLAK